MKTEDLDNLTLSQLLFSISELENSQEKPRYSGKMLNLFPQFTVKFKSKAWKPTELNWTVCPLLSLLGESISVQANATKWNPVLSCPQMVSPVQLNPRFWN